MNKKNLFTAICAGGLGIIFLFDSGNLSDGIRRGLSLCSGAVIPSLFPFMALSIFICKSAAADFLSSALRPVTKLLKIPERAGGILLAAAIGGYPAAAKCINDAVTTGCLSQKSASRMLTFCVNPGPPFLIAAVGGAMLGSAKAGIFLLLAQAASAIIIAAAGAFFAKKAPPSAQKSAAGGSTAACIIESIISAAESCFRMCAFIVIACGVLGVCEQGYFFTHICNSPLYKALFAGFFEVTAGCAACGAIGGTAAIIAAGVISAFSGVSVMLQVAAVTEESRISLIPFLLSRPVAAAISAILLKIFFAFSGESAAAFSARGGNINAVLSASAPVAVSLLCMAALFLLSLVPPKSESEPLLRKLFCRCKKQNPFHT